MKRLICSLGLLLALVAPASAQTVVTFSVTPSLERGLPGALLEYTGVLENVSDSPFTVVANFFDLSFPFLTLNDSAFASRFEGTYAPHERREGKAFEVQIAPNAPQGTYSGTFGIFGGTNPADPDTVAQASFDVQVTPEPSSFLLAGFCLPTLILLRRRRT